MIYQVNYIVNCKYKYKYNIISNNVLSIIYIIYAISIKMIY